jgi:hypothetical protein
MSSGSSRAGTPLWRRGDHLFDALACIGILLLCWYLIERKTGHPQLARVAPLRTAANPPAPRSFAQPGPSLPFRVQQGAASIPRAVGNADRQAKPVAIVVSSDRGSVEQVAETALERYGYSVHRARNGHEALQLAGRDTSVVVMMDGDDQSVEAQLRGLHPNINIVVVPRTATFAELSDRLSLTPRPVKR